MIIALMRREYFCEGGREWSADCDCNTDRRNFIIYLCHVIVTMTRFSVFCQSSVIDLYVFQLFPCVVITTVEILKSIMSSSHRPAPHIQLHLLQLTATYVLCAAVTEYQM